jgi:hypothetical protein
VFADDYRRIAVRKVFAGGKDVRSEYEEALGNTDSCVWRNDAFGVDLAISNY